MTLVDGLPRQIALVLVAGGVLAPLGLGIALGWISVADLIGALRVGVSLALGLALWIVAAIVDPKYR